MMRRERSDYTFIFFFLVAILLSSASSCRAENLMVNGGERLLIAAPHPDDETLACGGLIQRTKALGGTVHIVYLTAGDGCITINPVSLLSSHYTHRRIGLRRMNEAVAAMERFAVGRDDLTFLGYPDRGLMPLWRAQYGRKQEYRSRLTGANHVFYPGLDNMGMPYDRESLIQSLTTVINSFRPTMIVVPAIRDAHPDHRASHYFVKIALKNSSVHVRMLAYMVHYPSPAGRNRQRYQNIYIQYYTLSLVPGESECKREALRAYHSQFPSLNRLLNESSRTEEIFYEAEPEIVGTNRVDSQLWRLHNYRIQDFGTIYSAIPVCIYQYIVPKW